MDKNKTSVNLYIIPSHKYVLKIKKCFSLCLPFFAVILGALLSAFISPILGYLINFVLTEIFNCKINVSLLTVSVIYIIYIPITIKLLMKIGISLYPHYRSEYKTALKRPIIQNEISEENNENTQKYNLTFKILTLIIPFSLLVQLIMNITKIIFHVKTTSFSTITDTLIVGDNMNFFVIVIFLLNLIIFGPIVEESFRYLTIKIGKDIYNNIIFVNTIQAVLFALLHFNVLNIGYTFIAGLLFGYVLYKTNNLYFSVFLHSAYNLFNMIPLVLLIQNIWIQCIISGILIVTIILLSAYYIYHPNCYNNYFTKKIKERKKYSIS